MVIALVGMSGSAHGAPPPNNPTKMSLPPLTRTFEPDGRRLLAANQVNGRMQRHAGRVGDLLAHVGRAAVDHRHGAGLLGGLAFLGVDVDHDDALATHRLVQAQRHQAEAARPENDDRLFLEDVGDLLERAVGGDARARVGRRRHRIEALQVDEIFWMPHDDMVGITAVALDTEGPHRQAIILMILLAHFASAAALPGIDEAHLSHLDAARLGPDGDHLADRLVSHSERQGNAAIFQG